MPEEMRAEARAEARETVARGGGGCQLRRFFTTAGIDPYSTVEWERRSAVISGEVGNVVFEQNDVEIPKSWSQLATNVVVSKYFRGPLGKPERESSVRQLIGRVVRTIRGWGETQGYFTSREDADTFSDELTWLLLHQRATFNSPVWFNVGVEPKPQCSACFILSVEDTMDSILDWYRREGVIFKGGSGSGVNLSKIRSAREQLGGGGTASGPVSFMRAADASAGVIKSGGKTRRAAKMVVLNSDHPDILDFINCKAEEEKKAWTLIDAGYDGSLDGPAYASIAFPERQQLRSRDRRVHERRRRGEGLVDPLRVDRRAVRDDPRPRPHDEDRRGHSLLRRPGHAVRYHDQLLEYLPEHGPHQRVESLQRIHAPRRLGL